MLFREAALEHHRQGHAEGRVLLRSPRSFWWMSLVSLGLALAVLAMLFLVNYTQRARVGGRLVPDRGLVNLNAQQPGLVTEVLVGEGAEVRAGQVLLRLRAERSARQGELSLAAIRNLERQRTALQAESAQLEALADAQAQLLRQKQQDLQAALPRTQAEAAIQRRRLQSAEEALARYQALQSTGFMSPLQVQQRADDVLDQQARLVALERAEREAAAQLAAVAVELKAQQLRDGTPRTQAQRQLLALDQELAEAQGRAEWELRAPVDGSVTSLQVHPGQTAQPAQLLAVLLPKGARLQAELELPSSAAAFVRPGQRVQLRYAAFPYQKFGQHEGVVQELSRAALPTGAQASAERSYRVLVRPLQQTVQAYGQAVPLQVDMAVEADVMLSERSLIEWIFEPMIALKGRL